MTRRPFLAALSVLGLAPRLAPAQSAAPKIEPLRLSDAEWKQRLSPTAYEVLRHEGTEYPGSSPLNNEKRKGRFVCAGCDLPLFTSDTKFESGTGWPSFYASLPGAVATQDRPQDVHAAHRVPLRALRRPPGPRVRRRSGADRQALLQQRRRAEVRRRLGASAIRSPGRQNPAAARSRLRRSCDEESGRRQTGDESGEGVDRAPSEVGRREERRRADARREPPGTHSAASVPASSPAPPTTTRAASPPTRRPARSSASGSSGRSS